MEAGRFDGLFRDIDRIDTLLFSEKGKSSERLSADPRDPSSKDSRQERRLALDKLRAHYSVAGDSMSIREEGNYKFRVNHSELSANHFFLFPKFKLQFATEQYQDMLAMRNLCIADSVIDIHNALDPGTGVHSFHEHTRLRQNFTCVFG